MVVERDAEGHAVRMVGTHLDITKRKQTELALAESEERYRMLFEVAPAGILLIGSDGYVRAANLLQARLYGCESSQELVGMYGPMFIAESEREHATENMKTVLEGKELPDRTYTAVRRDGSEFFAEVTSVILRGPDERVQGYLCLSRDITERKAIEKQLEDHLQFEKLLTAISTKFISISHDRLADEINAAQRQICASLGLDICDLWQFSTDNPTNLFLTHYYVPPDLSLEIPESMKANESFPWSLEMMMKREPIVLRRITDAPPAAALDSDSWKHFGIKSVLTYPLYAGEGPVFGALNFSTIKAEQEWPEELINSLRIVSQIFANALNRKFTERNLRESEARLSDITFSMADWVWEVDEKGVYTYSSPKGYELLGDVIGKTPFDFMPPEEAKRAAEIFSEIAANKEPIKDLENWNIRKDGERICFLTNGVPILDKEGNLKGYRGVDKDITERIRVEEALRESEERYRGVVETQSEMICRFLPDTTLLFVNEAYVRYYGRSKEDLIGSQFLSNIPVELHEDIIRYLASFGPGSPVLTSEREVVFPDGTRGWQEWTDHAFFNADGRVTGFQSVGRDITERRNAEEILKQSETALRNSQRDLQKLAGRLIFAQEEELRRLSRELHDDLTQRLAVLAIDAGKLEIDLGKNPEACPEISQKISQIKDQLIKVSEDVHNISRQIHPTILDDLGLVRAIESECAAFMRREYIEIDFSKEDVPAAIGNDIGLCLYRVLQESLNNIMTHSRAKSCKIYLKGDKDTICLTVTDDGVGFDPAEVRQKQGLGLSSMRERVQLVHGDLSIKSQTGKGTVINVRVPFTGSGA
jgi:PAS domain S-box-containing protein